MSSSFQGVLDLFKAFPLVTYGVGIAQDLILSVMKNGPMPRHVALIMDGNRTFARNNNLPLKDGHNAGAQTLVQVCFRLGVEHVTVYAFSIENFNRSQEEVDTLFELLRDKLDAISHNKDSYTFQNKVRVKIIGNRTLIPIDILKDLEDIEARTSTTESKRVLNVCFPYTSRDDITHAIRQIAQRTVDGGINSTDIGVKDLHDSLYMGPDTPPLDLLIRTSGHTRLSDFLLWQCNSNCTIEFVNTLWPDFRFLSITLLLFKWLYYRALQLGDQVRETTSQTRPVKRDTRANLSDLPPPPIAVSVTEKAKPVHSSD